MRVVPGVLIERLPSRLWSTGNLRLLRVLHFCYGGSAERTVELFGHEVGRGTKSRLAEMQGHDG